MENKLQFWVQCLTKGLLVSLFLSIILISLETIMGKKLIFDQQLLIEVGYYFLYGISLTTVNAIFFEYFNKNIVRNSFQKYRFIIGVLGSVLISIATVFAIRFLIEVVFSKNTVQDFLTHQNAAQYVIPVLITIFVSLFFHAFYFYKKNQDKKVNQQKIIATTASAKFESLKNQIDPHFLFNSLNVLSSLIEENPANAQRFTTSLSKIYRYVLEQKDKELVTVNEELDFAKTYMSLLKMRFENGISFEIPDFFENTEAKVVPLCLQLLLENAVKHNIASDLQPLHIKIYIENDFLIIENNFQKKSVLQEGNGVGLQNIISRYAIISDRKMKIEENQLFFRVQVPILTKQISIMETTNFDEKNAYFNAKKRVEEIKGFYGNLSSYVVVISTLAIINLCTSPEYLWFFWPMLGWGIGVIFHGLRVFNYMPFLGSDWEEKKIAEIMEQEKNNLNNFK